MVTPIAQLKWLSIIIHLIDIHAAVKCVLLFNSFRNYNTLSILVCTHSLTTRSDFFLWILNMNILNFNVKGLVFLLVVKFHTYTRTRWLLNLSFLNSQWILLLGVIAWWKCCQTAKLARRGTLSTMLNSLKDSRSGSSDCNSDDSSDGYSGPVTKKIIYKTGKSLNLNSLTSS